MADLIVISDLSNNIDSCRRLIDNITKIHAQLDESQFCSHCSPDTKQPRLGLIIFYPDSDKPHSVYGVIADDFILIIEFLADKTAHTYPDNRQIPLKDKIERLETLLGVSLKN